MAPTRRTLIAGGLATLASSLLGLRGARAQPALSSRADESALLLHLREEEKLARDVYDRFAASEPLFATLADAERNHFEAVGRLLSTRGLHDPAQNRAPGAFEDRAFAELYTAFVARGTTPVARLEVGLEIEELDLSDLERALAIATSPDVRRVFTNLARGSRNHLRHLHASLAAAGGSYAPRHLSREAYDAIVGSPIERGGGGGGGYGRGRRGPP